MLWYDISCYGGLEEHEWLKEAKEIVIQAMNDDMIYHAEIQAAPEFYCSIALSF